MLHNQCMLSRRDMKLLLLLPNLVKSRSQESLNGIYFKSVFRDPTPSPGLEKHLRGLHGAQRIGKWLCGSQFPEPPPRCPSATLSQYLLFPSNQMGPWLWLPGSGCLVLSSSSTQMSPHHRTWHILRCSRTAGMGLSIPGIPPHPLTLS